MGSLLSCRPASSNLAPKHLHAAIQLDFDHRSSPLWPVDNAAAAPVAAQLFALILGQQGVNLLARLELQLEHYLLILRHRLELIARTRFISPTAS